MTLDEVIDEIKKDTPLNRACKEFRFASARIARIQNPIEARKAEFEVVRKIADILSGKE